MSDDWPSIWPSICTMPVPFSKMRSEGGFGSLVRSSHPVLSVLVRPSQPLTFGPPVYDHALPGGTFRRVVLGGEAVTVGVPGQDITDSDLGREVLLREKVARLEARVAELEQAQRLSVLGLVRPTGAQIDRVTATRNERERPFMDWIKAKIWGDESAWGGE